LSVRYKLCSRSDAECDKRVAQKTLEGNGC